MKMGTFWVCLLKTGPGLVSQRYFSDQSRPPPNRPYKKDCCAITPMTDSSGRVARVGERQVLGSPVVYPRLTECRKLVDSRRSSDDPVPAIHGAIAAAGKWTSVHLLRARPCGPAPSLRRARLGTSRSLSTSVSTCSFCLLVDAVPGDEQVFRNATNARKAADW